MALAIRKCCVGLLAVTAAVICGNAANAQPLRYAEDRSPAIVNPLFTTSMSEARVNELIFEGLFSDSQELKSVPLLAERFELSEDRMSMTIWLRQDVSWHDGMRFTSKDVVFTIGAMNDPQIASTESGRVSWIDSIEAIDEYTVRLSFLAEEYAPFEKLHFKILPAHPFEETRVDRNHSFKSHPVGTGPMSFSGFNADNSISLTRYQDYHGGARLDEVVMREVSDKNYQSKLLLYGSLDALVRVLPKDIAVLQGDRGVELYPYQTNSWWCLGYNMRNETFQDRYLRAALELMIDRQSLLAPIGTGELLSGPFVKSSPFYNHDVPQPKPSPSDARMMMTEAGYELIDGKWVKGDMPVTLRIAAQRNVESALEVVVNLQTQLQNQGIQIEPVFLDAAQWHANIWGSHDFDIVLTMWSFDRNEDIYEQFHSQGARNFGGYRNPDVDKLLDDAMQARDPQTKKDLLRAVHSLVAADDPMVFLWTLDSYSALSTKVHNVIVHPFYFFTWANDWYIQ